MALVAPQEKYNQGLIAPLKVIAPKGTLFNATHPAPVSIYWEALTYAADLVWKALAAHVPERLTAGHYLSIVGEIIAGIRDDNQEPFALVEPNPGGWGAGRDQDGESGLVCFADGETFASSVEVLEARYPLRVDRYEYNTETGFGHGEYRGGAGIIKDYRILNQSADFTTDINRAIIPPWGMHGGSSGTLNRIQIYRGGEKILDTRQALSFKLKYDDVVSIRTGGGGGWGNPLERSTDAVKLDVAEGFLSVEDAERVYGVVFNPQDFRIDVLATKDRRKVLSAEA
jgi:N-methylhydantoinase B